MDQRGQTHSAILRAFEGVRRILSHTLFSGGACFFTAEPRGLAIVGL